MAQKNGTWIHIKADNNVADLLDRMVFEDDSDRSKFVRQLIREEFVRRAGSNVVKIDRLSGPKGADRPVLMKEGEQ